MGPLGHGGDGGDGWRPLKAVVREHINRDGRVLSSRHRIIGNIDNRSHGDNHRCGLSDPTGSYGIGKAIGPVEVGSRGIAHCAGGRIDDRYGSVGPLGHGGDGWRSLKAVVRKHINRDGRVLISRHRIIGNIDNGSHGESDDLGRGIPDIIGEGHAETVAAVVIGVRRITPGAAGRIDTGTAVGCIGGHGIDGSIGETISIGRTQGSGDIVILSL